MATTQGNGVSYDRPDLTLLDTRELRWEEFPGLQPGPESAAGCLIRSWRDGIGNWLDDPNAAEESPDVPYPA